MKQELKIFNKLALQLLEEEQKNPVVKPVRPDELFKKLDIHLQNKSVSEDQLIQTLQSIIAATPKTASAHFFNQLFGGRNPKATLGDLLAVLLNNSMYTYKVAGVQVGIEKEIINKVCEKINFPKTAGGTIATGGSMCNFMGMLLARDAFNNTIKQDGVFQKLIVYTSKESHYSIPKNASFLGLGRKQVRYIACNEKGEMQPEDLEKQVQKDVAAGLHPFFVNATAGTTVLGSFDPIEPISEICKKHNLWLHVDGAYCGAVLFSEKYKNRIKGVSKADSFCFNAHKMLGTPLTCSVFVVRDKKYLYESLSNEADYLYQTDEDDYNLGKTSFQCGRRNDALKLWTLWKAVGTEGLELMVNKQFELAEAARNYIKSNPDYTLYSYDDSVSICFNYKDIPAKKLCTLLYEHGKLMVGYGSFNNKEFIRLVTINASNNTANILNFFKILEDFVTAHKSLF